MNSKNTNTEPILTPLFIIVMLLNLAASVTMQFFNSTYSLQMDSIGKSSTIAGLVVSTGALAATVYCFFGGALANRLGRRKLITAGFVVYGIMSFLIAIAQPLGQILLIRIIQMIGYSVASTTISVVVVDVLPRTRVGEGIGYYGLAANLASAAGPSAALFIQQNHSFFALMAISSAICLCGALLSGIGLNYEKTNDGSRTASGKLPEDAPAGSGYTGVWKFIEKTAVIPSVLNLVITMTTMLLTLYLFLFASRIGIKNAGLHFTISVILMVFVRIISEKISDRKGVLYSLLPGIVSLVICFILLIMCSSFSPLYYLSAVFEGIGAGMVTPALNAEAVRKASKERSRIASSTFFMSMGIVVIIASLLWGFLIDHTAFRNVFVIAVGILIVSAAIGIAVFRRKRPA